MTQIVPFRPLAEASAEENLAAFIAYARDKMKGFGSTLDFDADYWDVRDYVLEHGERSNRGGIPFTRWVPRGKERSAPPLSHRVMEFAKAYTRQRAHLCIGYHCHTVKVFRAMDEAMELLNIDSLARCNIAVLDKAAEVLAGRLKSTTAAHLGATLQMIAQFLDSHGFVAAPIGLWRYPSRLGRRQDDAGRAGQEFVRKRGERMPDPDALEALPKAFRLATDPRDIIVTSVAAIMCAAPERINEVLQLRADCEVERRGSDGRSYLGLRWAGSKGAKDHIKWVLPSMAEVVREAIQRIRRQTDKARMIAKWYEQHPTSLYLPPDLAHLRNAKLLSTSDFAAVTGAMDDSNIRGTIGKLGLPKYRIRGTDGFSRLAVSFKDVERLMLGRLPRGFPIRDTRTGLRYSESLFVVTHGLFVKKRSALATGSPCMFEPVDYSRIANGLGGPPNSNTMSVFSKIGLDPDRKLRIKSHQFRHYLNTLAHGSGLSEIDIAKWSGRVDVSQNPAYNHVSSEEILTKLRSAVGNKQKAIGGLADIPRNLPVSRDEFAELAIPTAHTTEYGFCTHDFVVSPCELFRRCLECREQVCVKGDPLKTERIRQAAAQAQLNLERARKAAADDYYGADAWVATHSATVLRLEQLVAILDDPDVPDGAVIQLGNSGIYSLAEGAIRDRLSVAREKAEVDDMVPMATAVRAIGARSSE